MDSKTLEKLDETGVKVLEKLSEATTSGIELIEKEAPQLCAKIIALGRVYNSVLIVGGILLVLVSIYLFYKMCKAVPNNFIGFNPPNSAQDFGIIIGFLGSILGSIVGITTFCTHVYPLCLVTFAPRLYLIEYIVELVKK